MLLGPSKYSPWRFVWFGVCHICLCLGFGCWFLIWGLSVLARLVLNSWVQSILLLSLLSRWNYRHGPPCPAALDAFIYIFWLENALTRATWEATGWQNDPARDELLTSELRNKYTSILLKLLHFGVSLLYSKLAWTLLTQPLTICASYLTLYLTVQVI